MNIIVFQMINYTLSFFMWTVLGRVIVTLIVGNRPNFIVGLFQKVTDPAYRVTKTVLPFVSDKWVPAMTVLVIVVLRLALIIVFAPATSR